jgi:hypothetical protein
MPAWLLLTYRLPSEPSARRVYIWRKLKRLGSISIYDAVWVLPETPQTHEHFQWLAAEIQELGGETMFWRSQAEMVGQEEKLINLFQQQVVEAYRALMQRMDHQQITNPEAAKEYRQIRQKDYFPTEIGLQIQQRLLAAMEDPQ